MDMQLWKNAIEKQGGLELVVEFHFDNSRLHVMDPAKPVSEQVVLDEENDCWVFITPNQPYMVNGKEIPQAVIEANEGLQAVRMARDAKTRPYVRKDVI